MINLKEAEFSYRLRLFIFSFWVIIQYCWKKSSVKLMNLNIPYLLYLPYRNIYQIKCLSIYKSLEHLQINCILLVCHLILTMFTKHTWLSPTYPNTMKYILQLKKVWSTCIHIFISFSSMDPLVLLLYIY